MNKYLVTGNAGFLGSYIADELLDMGEVYGIDNMSGGFKRNINPKVKHFILDLHNPQTKEFINYLKPDYLIYCAADAREGRSQFTPSWVTRDNLMAYTNTLSTCIENGVKKVIYLSSMSVYGKQKPPFDEKKMRAPEDVYAVNKVACERTTEILCDTHDVRYTIIRPHNCVGKRQRIDDPYRNVIGIWMNRIMQGKPPLIYGDGKQKRAFTPVDNFTPYVIKSLNKVADGQIFNIGPDREITINYACQVVLDVMGSDLKPEYVPWRPREVKKAWCTVGKAKELLNYEDKQTFEECVSEMAKWAKKLGPKPFKHLDKLEINNDKVPAPWRKKTT
jgi:UDP-glucose 4-epimerase